MKLYIDESGNTGETLSNDGNFNFKEQPFYVLSGLFLDDDTKIELEKFVEKLKNEHHIQGDELKSKNIYKNKSKFLKELTDYIADKKILVFSELMDKLYYIHTQLIEYFIVPYYSLEFTDSNIEKKRIAASELGQFLNQNIYDSFFQAVKLNTNESLEKFYEILINHFESINENALKSNVESTKKDYFKQKENDAENALKMFFPIPDENPNNRLIHLLPNYNAFTNLIGRAQGYIDKYTNQTAFSIIHDEQKQFDVIFQKALDLMKEVDADSIIEKTKIALKGTFNLNENIDLRFVDSKTDITIQVADLIAGFTMRFWSDFKNNNQTNIKKYLSVMTKMNFPLPGSSVGINYMVPYIEHIDISRKMMESTMPNTVYNK